MRKLYTRNQTHKMNCNALLKKITLTLIGLTLLSSLQARHIIGGVITYECLGNDRYKFVMKMYRDCNCSDCALFDSPASIGVYRCEDLAECQGQAQRDVFFRLDVPIKEIKSIEAPDYPCLIPPDVCVEEGTYEFTLTLPRSNESYHISYQRCCRNVTISNIIQPDRFGATFTIELTPKAQELCNSSPVFDDFPPTVICAGAPLTFDHSATDKDGDQLVYEFCAPLDGGGRDMDNPLLAGGCTWVAPTPACPPPYNSVIFRAPAYTSVEPMSGNPVINIDPNTGVISGTPTILGQFVVGVCVSEYRNGELLSRVFRDFQFNVANCDPQVVARVRSDEVIDGREYLINSCGVTSVTIENESFLQQFIKTWEWRFDINGTEQQFSEWSPTVTFPGVGQYIGQLYINPGTDCGDTAKINVNIFPAIAADFEFEYDTCVAGPVDFTDLSVSGSGIITAWDWNFGDDNKSTTQNPSHVYREPGNIPVSLTVTDINKCKDTRTQNIPYFPVPALIVIEPSAFSGCVPAAIFFNNLSFPIDETYDIRWDFGDGGTSEDISPTHIFQSPGNFTVSVDITSPIGCETDKTFPNLIAMLPAPEAGFSFAPDAPSNINPTVSFTDLSQGAIGWFWDFDNGANSTLRNPIYTFPDTGMYLVKQIVTHPSGCKDTLAQLIDIAPEVRFYLPNAFTPNADALNDTYKGVGIMQGAINFKLTIWNRWGEMIFESDDPDEGWNGRKFNTGADAPPGVYVVVVTFTGPRGEPFEIKGYATLIR